ncbi:MAG: hypothetical protein U1F35_14780 [Steroidobacteraceae bacterium]
MHGAASLPVLYLAGWVSSRHATLQWKLRKRRASGSLFLLLLVLAASGFALFFLHRRCRATLSSAVAHEGDRRARSLVHPRTLVHRSPARVTRDRRIGVTRPQPLSTRDGMR